MGTAAKRLRYNRTITLDFHDEMTYDYLLNDDKAFVELVIAFILAMGFQLRHKATCSGGGCLTRHSHYIRVRLGGLTIWRIQCPRCKAVFTVLPHFVLRSHSMRPDVARNALLATHGGLSLELCAVLYHISPMALYCLVCARGQQSAVTILIRVGCRCLSISWPMRSTRVVSPTRRTCPRLSAAVCSGISATPRRPVQQP